MPKEVTKTEPIIKISFSKQTELLRSSDPREADLKVAHSELTPDTTRSLQGDIAVTVLNIKNTVTLHSYEKKFTRVLPVSVSSGFTKLVLI